MTNTLQPNMSICMGNIPFKIIVMLFVLLPVSAFSSDVTLRLVYGTEQAYPYLMGYGPTIPDPKGIAIDIIEHAAEDLGIKLKLKRLPDKRLFVELEKGTADGNFIQSFKESRLKYGAYPVKNGKPDTDKRITTLSYFLYKKKDSNLQATVDSFTTRGVVIAAKRGFSIVDDLKNLGAEVVEVNTSSSLFKMLDIGRVDAVALQDTEGDFHIKSTGMTDIEKIYPPLKTKHYYLMFSHQFVRNNPEIANKLWTRISELRDPITTEKRALY